MDYRKEYQEQIEAEQKLFEKAQKERKEKFVIVQKDSVVCRVEGNIKLVPMDQAKEEKIYLEDTKEEAEGLINYSMSFGNGKAITFEDFLDEYDFDACEFCNSLNVDWNGASGDGGRWVGYQEASWLECKSCGRAGTAE